MFAVVLGNWSICYTGDRCCPLKLESVMAKKGAAKKSATSAKKVKKPHQEQVVLDPVEEKALRLVGKSAKIQAQFEEAAMLAVGKAVRKVMKDHGISLTPPQVSRLASIWFGE
jgi:hypothetical protein